MNSKVNSKRCLLMVLVIVISMGENVKADFTFGTPANLGSMVNTSSDDTEPAISTDGLELYFASYQPGGFGDCDIWVTTRATMDDEWGEPTNLGPLINSSIYEGGPCPSVDGLTLYFANNNDGIMVTRRATKSDNWGTPVALGPALNIGTADSAFPAISFDGLQLYFSEHSLPRPGGFGGADLWMSARSAVSDAWDPPLNLGPTVNSSSHDRFPSISTDGLSLFFNSNRPGGHGGHDIWFAMRVTEDADWNAPVNLGPMVNTSSHESGPSISADGRTIYFHSGRPGGYDRNDIWQVSIEPVVDLNIDGIVDAADMCIIVDNWGTDEALCDIGPMPWGDGIVDVQDLIILAEHLFEEIPPVEPVE